MTEEKPLSIIWFIAALLIVLHMIIGLFIILYKIIF